MMLVFGLHGYGSNLVYYELPPVTDCKYEGTEWHRCTRDEVCEDSSIRENV